MIERTVLLALTVYAIVEILLSNLIGYLFMDRFLKWLQKKNYLFTYELVTCRSCLGFWLVVGICVISGHHGLLILAVYGLFILMIKVGDGGSKE